MHTRKCAQKYSVPAGLERDGETAGDKIPYTFEKSLYDGLNDITEGLGEDKVFSLAQRQLNRDEANHAAVQAKTVNKHLLRKEMTAEEKAMSKETREILATAKAAGMSLEDIRAKLAA